MKFTTFIFMVLSIILLFAQCEQEDFSSREHQKKEIINEFLDLSMNDYLLFDLYDSNELTILECKKILQELSQGKELKAILSVYLSEIVDLQLVYEYFYETARLTQELRRYNVSEGELKLMIERHPSIKSNFSNRRKKGLITTRSWNINYKRCVRYAEEDYDDCIDNAIRRGVTTWGQVAVGSTLGGFTAAGPYGLAAGAGVGFFVVGPIFGVMDYGHERDVCAQQKEKDLIRCEEKYK